MIFMDGECEKCGGHTYSHSIDTPLKCSRCGAEYPVSSRDMRIIKAEVEKRRGSKEKRNQ